MTATLGNAWTILLGTKTIVEHKIENLKIRLFWFSCILISIILAQWAVNAFLGAPGFNLILFFLVGFYLVWLLISPVYLGWGAGLGAAYAALRDQDLSQGALSGIIGLYRVVIAAIFFWWVISGALATWPFAKAPTAFFFVAAALLVLVAMGLHYGIRAKWVVKTVVTIYTVTIIILALWKTIPDDIQASVFSSEDGSATQTRGTLTTVPYSPASIVLSTDRGECATINVVDESLEEYLVSKLEDFTLNKKGGTTPTTVRLSTNPDAPTEVIIEFEKKRAGTCS